jgi:hypothetical protein
MLQSKALLLMPIQLLYPVQWFGKLDKASLDQVRGKELKLHQRIPTSNLGLSRTSPVVVIILND